MMGEAPLKMTSALLSDLGTELPLHLSLSRPNVLRTEERVVFTDLLEGRIKKLHLRPYGTHLTFECRARAYCLIFRFKISFTGFEWVSNLDGNRWFFVMKATSKDNEVRPMSMRSSSHSSINICISFFLSFGSAIFRLPRTSNRHCTPAKEN